MIDYQLYRARIGAFASKSLTSLVSYFHRKKQFNEGKFRSQRKLLPTRGRGINVLVLMTCLVAFVLCVMNVKTILKIAGDIESNPGPYELLKSIQGSFNQGNIAIFGETAGRQCACNALFSICWSLVKKISCWTTLDLDHILIQGDNLYKTLNKESFLSVDDLPREVRIFQYSASVEMREESLHDGVAFLGEPFLRNTLLLFGNCTGCLLFICSYVVAILKHSAVRMGTSYFIFDSHCRNRRGITDSATGFSVLLQFADIGQVERYIEEAYNISNRDYPPYFQIQFVSVHINESDLGAIQSRQVNLFRNLKRKAKQGSEKVKQNQATRKENSKQGMKKTRLSQDIPKMSDSKYRISIFKKSIQSGPSSICIVCNRCLYRRSVTLFSEKKHRELVSNMFHYIRSPDNNFYVCKTCTQKINKNQIPCQAVCNKLEIFDLPEDLRPIRRLEKVLIARRIQFKKITIMPKGQSPKLKGAICNIPIDVVQTYNTLPPPADSNGLVVLKLKRKLAYRGHVYFEPVRPRLIFRLLQFLKEKNPLYSDVDINLSNIPDYLIQPSLSEKCCSNANVLDYVTSDEFIPIVVESVDCKSESHESNTGMIEEALNSINSNYEIPIVVENESTSKAQKGDTGIGEEELIDFEINSCGDKNIHSNDNSILNPDQTLDVDENPLDVHKCASDETVLINTSHDNEFISIAPGEGYVPIPLTHDLFCEELSHPHLFPYGKFGFQIKRSTPLSPTKYFNQRLLNYTQKFASDSDYIFFAHKVMQGINLNNQINIAMRKVATDKLTAGMLCSNFKEKVKDFIGNDKAFTFMSGIKGTPAYWKKFLFDVLAMVKQLGCPTFFMTLSSADLRWNELVSLISEMSNLKLSKDNIENMPYHDRCRLLNSNPVLVARHFQYRVELFFKEIVIDGPLGKTKYYAIRVEFQVRGSPHVHCFLWIWNAPKLSESTEDEYISFVDKIVHATLPNQNDNPDLYELVKMYQLHRHSKTCYKYKKQACRFHFGKFFSKKTIVAAPLPPDLAENVKQFILTRRKDILAKVQNYIDNYLNPAKVNFYDSTKKDTFVKVKSISEVLQELNISELEYESALSISDDKDFQLHLRRPTDSCFINNYFVEGLLAWEANIDIQPVFNYYKAVTYMCSYLSKEEDECSQAMKQAFKETLENGSSYYEQMKSVAHAYSSKRECSLQEAVYHIMPELWLRKVFPAVVNVNSNLPEKRVKMILTKNELSKLPEDSTDIFKRNMVNRYIIRPQVLDKICYASFVKKYQIVSKQIDNDSQPNELPDEVIEENHWATNDNLYPKNITLSTGEKLRCRKVEFVLRYYVPNKHKDPEAYAHHLLFMFYPFRNEDELKVTQSHSYSAKLQEPEVINIINENKRQIEPFCDLVDEAYLNFRSDLPPNWDSFAQQENEDVNNDTFQESNCEQEENDNNVNQNCEMSEPSPQNIINQAQVNIMLNDDDISQKIRSLNMKQRQVFDYIYSWARSFIISKSSKQKQVPVKPFRLFLSGGGGCGKSHLIKTVHGAVSKLFLIQSGCPDKPRILVLAPTGVAAININGTTIHSALHIPCRGKLMPLSGENLAELRNKYSEVKMIIIDEISMVSGKLLYQVHKRLNEIFSPLQDIPFGGKSILVCGDFYQLPPVVGKPVFMFNDTETSEGFLMLDLWHKFKMIELTEIMRQKGDIDFIKLLNKIRIGTVDDKVDNMLRPCFLQQADKCYPYGALHIYAENNPANRYNEQMLNTLPFRIIDIPAKDVIPKNCSMSDVLQAQNRKQSETGGLAILLKVKINARVMVTTNIDLSDRLINGQIGSLKYFRMVGNEVDTIYVAFDDTSAGLKRINSNDAIAKINKWVPIKREETTIYINKFKITSPFIRRTQFPLMLSWACTVHKVQGLSLNEGVISFDLERQKSFNQGQMYVALSRVKNIQNLHLTGTYSQNAFQVNSNVTIEYNRLRESSYFVPLNTITKDSKTLTVSLLNTRSLRRHAQDIAKDKNLMGNDILCLTELQLCQEDNLTDLKQLLAPYQLHLNLEWQSYQNIGFCVANSIVVSNHEMFPGLSILEIIKESFYSNAVRILLLYRSPNASLTIFYSRLEVLLSTCRMFDLILGDFNINALSSNNNLQNIMSQYQLLNQDPTHISGSLLDHVYIRREALQYFSVEAIQTTSVHFSDHQAVKVRLSLP